MSENRSSVDHESQDGYLANTGGIGPKIFDDTDYTALRGSLVLEVRPNIENYTIVSYVRSRTNGAIEKINAADPSTFLGALTAAQLAEPGATGFYNVQTNLSTASSNEEHTRLINTTTWHVSKDLIVKNIASYAQLEENLASPLFGIQLDLHNYAAVVPKGFYLTFVNTFPPPGGHSTDERTITEELQVQGKALDARLTYQGGGYMEFADPIGLSGSYTVDLLHCASDTSTLCANTLGAGSFGAGSSEVSYTDLALYGQSSYEITSKLKLTTGFRYTWDRASTNSNFFTNEYSAFTLTTSPSSGTICLNPDDQLPSCYQHAKQVSSAPTGLVDLDYKPTRDILAYIKYSRGYRAGGITPSSPTGFITYEPETVDAYEGGLKTSFRGPFPGTFDVAGFYNDLHNEQLAVDFAPKVTGAEPPAQGEANAGAARLFGTEAELNVMLFKGFTLDAAYTYLNTRIQRIGLPAIPGNSPYMIQANILAGEAS